MRNNIEEKYLQSLTPARKLDFIVELLEDVIDMLDDVSYETATGFKAKY